jgi:Mn-dependent DtxR family transcriptional regulator
VHEDAEKIEHILGADTVRKLERDLNFPEFDPHGKPIPSLESTLQMQPTIGKQEDTGY